MAEHQGIEITWIDGGREPTQAANPQYPEGVDVNLADGAGRSCRMGLPYPAPRVGHWRLTCVECGLRVAVTAAGRADDPRSVTLGCIPSGEPITTRQPRGADHG